MPQDKGREVVLVTGSAGLIGSRTVERLAERFAVVGFDHEGHKRHPPPVAECVCVDLTREDRLETALKRVRYAYGSRLASVVHLAAYYDFSGEPNDRYDEVTVGGTRTLLNSLRDFEVEQLIFSSTILVHKPSPGPGNETNEEWPLEPKWPYPESKVETEKLIREMRGEMPVVIVRIAGVYDDQCHSIPLAHQIQRIYEDRLVSHLFPGDVTHGQSFVHREDVAEAIVQAVARRHDLPDEFVVLIGEDNTLSYQELQDAFGQHLRGRPWPTREIPKPLAKAGSWVQDALPGEDPFIKPFMIDLADDHYELDIARARRHLQWEPQRSLWKTIPKMCNALLKDPQAWYRQHHLDGKPGNPPAREEPPKPEGV